jgi:hypothetical protein
MKIVETFYEKDGVEPFAAFYRSAPQAKIGTNLVRLFLRPSSPSCLREFNVTRAINPDDFYV